MLWFARFQAEISFLTDDETMVDGLGACGALARGLEELHAKLLTYVGGAKGRRMDEPSIGWTVVQALRRLAHYTGGITVPVLLTELHLAWVKGGAEVADVVGERVPVPVEVALKQNCPSKCAFRGHVWSCGGDEEAESVELRGSRLESNGAAESTAEGGTGADKGRGVKFTLPLALRRRLQRSPTALPVGRGVTLGGCKALTVAGKGRFLSPSESLLISIHPSEERDLRFLLDRLGLAVQVGPEGVRFAQEAPAQNDTALVCCRVVGTKDSPIESSISVEVLHVASRADVAAGGAEMQFHESQAALAGMLDDGDHLVLEIPRRGEGSSALERVSSEGPARLKCGRGIVFYKVWVEPDGANSVERGAGFRSLGSVGGSGLKGVTVIGIVTHIKGVEKSQSFPNDYTCYELGLEDEEGCAVIELGFQGKWDAGLVEQGHMVALTGVRDAAAVGAGEKLPGGACTWSNSGGNAILNLSCMHSRLYSKFAAPGTVAGDPASSRVTVLGCKNVSVRTLHRQCLRRVQNVVIDFFDDENDVECCTASAAATTQTPETPNKSGGLYECSFCRTDCSAADVVLGYSGDLEVETRDQGAVTVSVDPPALRKLIQMEPLHFKRCPRQVRKAHLDSLVGKELEVLFYRSPQNATRKRIFEETEAVGAGATDLCISIIDG